MEEDPAAQTASSSRGTSAMGSWEAPLLASNCRSAATRFFNKASSAITATNLAARPTARSTLATIASVSLGKAPPVRFAGTKSLRKVRNATTGEKRAARTANVNRGFNA